MWLVVQWTLVFIFDFPVNQFTQYVGDCGTDDDFSYDLDSNVGFVDGAYQVIKWQNFNTSSWNTLTDANFKDLWVMERNYTPVNNALKKVLFQNVFRFAWKVMWECEMIISVQPMMRMQL